MLTSIFNRDTKPIKIGFIAKSFALCASGMTAIAMMAGHAANAYFYNKAPTPFQFATSQGLSFKPETIAYLKEFDDIRVLTADSPLREAFCSLPMMCDDTVKHGGDFALTPSGVMQRMVGTRPIVFLKTYHSKFNEQMVYFTTAKQAVHSEEKSEAAFKWTMLHELGHVKASRVKGAAVYNALPVDQKEADADQYAQPHLEREAGAKAGRYSVHFRGLTQFDQTHDVLPKIYGAQTGRTATSFQTVIDECGASGEFTFKTAPKKLDQIYDCLKSAKTSPAEPPEMTLRKESYVAGWEFFFKP